MATAAIMVMHCVTRVNRSIYMSGMSRTKYDLVMTLIPNALM
jgi:hypothetical protein